MNRVPHLIRLLCPTSPNPEYATAAFSVTDRLQSSKALKQAREFEYARSVWNFCYPANKVNRGIIRIWSFVYLRVSAFSLSRRIRFRQLGLSVALVLDSMYPKSWVDTFEIV
jgi:hypothetical protein